MSIAAWLQYVLDNFATVDEALTALLAEPFAIIAPTLPDGHAATGHLSIADQSGDSAIFEYIDGALVIHHDRAYTVMTNSPPFDQQLAIDAYWQDVGGMEFLPGTGRAADRFVRASWYLDAVEKVPEPRVATATVFSLVRGVSVPIGLADPKKPNLSSTMWRTVADLGAKRYFYESVFSPSVFWVDIDTLGLGEGTGVRKLELGGSPILAGEVSAEFKPSEPFGFLTN